jgi:hypothetical protein
MKHFFLVMTLLLFVMESMAQSVNDKDFGRLVGTWKGKLRYLDYSSGKPYEMPADVVVRKLSKGVYELEKLYPDEPKANGKDTVRVGNGMMYGAKVVSKKKVNGDTEVVTEESGLDGNDRKPALIRKTYCLGKNKFEIKKEVRFEGSEIWIERHRFMYSR